MRYEVPDLEADAGGGEGTAAGPGPLRLHVAGVDPSPLEVLTTAMMDHYAAHRFDKATSIARDAAPFCHMKQTSVEHAGSSDRPLRFASMGERELERLIACLIVDDKGERQ
jgi:hypothetical protein